MRLREYTVPGEVPHYSCAISPGRHCPLFGAAAVLRGVAGATLMYIGTQDCVYYAQKDALTRQLSSGKASEFRTLAVQLSDSDLIFGIRPQLEKLLEEEARREATHAIFLVTSCSVEVISEDIQSVVSAVAERTGKKIALVPTENFKTFSYIEGIEDTLGVLTAGMKTCVRQPKTFAVLGARQPGAEMCEPVKYLIQRGYRLHSILPYEIDAGRVETLPGVGFTLVVDGSGVDVGLKLKEQFGIPCIRFDRKLDLESIVNAWRCLGQVIGEDVEAFVKTQLAETEALAERVRALVSGKKFFFGQKVLYPFETCLFIADLGMTPTCIFMGSVVDKTDAARQALARRFDPVIWQNANQAAIQAMLEKDLPDYVIGITTGVVRNYSVRAIGFRIKPVECGFAYYQYCLREFLNAERMET